MQLAINLPDLIRVPPMIRGMLLEGKLDTSQAINVDKSRVDEAAVIFTCDLLTAACACDTIRAKDRYVKRYPTRVYMKKVKAWRKVSGNVDLAQVVSDGVQLNPKVFPRNICEGEASEHTKKQRRLEHIRKLYGRDIKACWSGVHGYLIEVPESIDVPDEWGNPIEVMRGGARRYQFPPFRKLGDTK